MLSLCAVPNAPVITSKPVYLQERPGILAELNTSFNLTVSRMHDGSISYPNALINLVCVHLHGEFNNILMADILGL